MNSKVHAQTYRRQQITNVIDDVLSSHMQFCGHDITDILLMLVAKTNQSYLCKFPFISPNELEVKDRNSFLYFIS